MVNPPYMSVHTFISICIVCLHQIPAVKVNANAKDANAEHTSICLNIRHFA